MQVPSQPIGWPHCSNHPTMTGQWKNNPYLDHSVQQTTHLNKPSTHTQTLELTIQRISGCREMRLALILFRHSDSTVRRCWKNLPIVFWCSYKQLIREQVRRAGRRWQYVTAGSKHGSKLVLSARWNSVVIFSVLCHGAYSVLLLTIVLR